MLVIFSMSNDQRILLREPKEKKSFDGPVFESGPGWGAKIQKWLGKYFYKAVLPIMVVVLIIYGISTRTKVSTDLTSPAVPTITNASGAVISEVVGKGDGMINIARRAIASYLLSNPTETATPGQRVYAETVLASTMDKSTFKAGSTITFNSDDIKTQLDNSKLLTAGQLVKWNTYAAKAGVK